MDHSEKHSSSTADDVIAKIECLNVDELTKLAGHFLQTRDKLAQQAKGELKNGDMTKCDLVAVLVMMFTWQEPLQVIGAMQHRWWSRNPKKRNQDRDAKVHELKNKGFTSGQIRRKLGMTQDAVRNVLYRKNNSPTLKLDASQLSSLFQRLKRTLIGGENLSWELEDVMGDVQYSTDQSQKNSRLSD